MIPLLIFLLLVSTFVLIKSADHVVISLRRLSRNSKTTSFVLSSLLLALATSFPEFFVGLTSAFTKTSNLSFGNVVGANITNISLVVGLSGIIVGKVNFHSEFFRKDIIVAFFAGIIPFLLLWDNELGSVDGLILVSVYCAYASSFFKKRFLQIAREHREESFIHRFFQSFTYISNGKGRELGRLFVSVALLLFSADIIVRISKILAGTTNLPIFIVGLVIIALGTTLPELVFSVQSIHDRQPTMFLGNLLGSIIANSTLILGIVALVHPISVSTSDFVSPMLFFIVIFLTFGFFIKTKLKIERWESSLLFLFYLLFLLVELVG